ncbi:hypothetical protein BLOT_016203 [Blomia tropicalis]|nr:hypothetical protein BLOT_016203 [Blomia tropicalis]
MIGFFHPLEDTTQYDYGCSFASTKHHSQVSRQWPGLTPLPTRVGQPSSVSQSCYGSMVDSTQTSKLERKLDFYSNEMEPMNE